MEIDFQVEEVFLVEFQLSSVLSKKKNFHSMNFKSINKSNLTKWTNFKVNKICLRLKLFIRTKRIYDVEILVFQEKQVGGV